MSSDVLWRADQSKGMWMWKEGGHNSRCTASCSTRSRGSAVMHVTPELEVLGSNPGGPISGNAVPSALGCLGPHEPEGVLRGIRRVTLRWSLGHAQVPYLTFTLPYLTLPYLTLPYLTLPYLTLPYLTLPYLTLPYLTLPYLTLPYLTLPYLTLHCKLLRTTRESDISAGSVKPRDAQAISPPPAPPVQEQRSAHSTGR